MQSQNDIESIKSKIIEQINSQYDEKKAKEFSDKIIKMSNEEFIEFLKQQGLIKDGKDLQDKQCIFCSIASKQIPSTKISENEKAIAILEINPVSKGHTIIIPKEHVEKESEIPEDAKNLAKFVEELIKKSLNPKKIEIINSEVMGHQIINVLPVYSDETINSKRENKTPEELEQIKKELEENSKKEEEKNIEPPKEEKLEINEENTWLPKRVP